MDWKEKYVDGEEKTCLNCNYSTEEYLHDPHGICPRSVKFAKDLDTCVRDMGIEPCWESNL